MSGKLYRNESGGMLAGVCSGLGDYLAIDPVWIRLFFVLITLTSGVGIPIYIAMWLVVPQEDGSQAALSTADRPANVVMGAILLGLGLLFLAQNLNFHWFGWFNFATFWPLLLIAIGGYSVWRAVNEA